MRITQRMTWFVVLAAIFTTLSIYMSFTIFVTPKITAVEDNYVIEKADMVRYVVSEWTETLKHTALDWSIWDDMYLFSQGKNIEFAANNLDSDSVSNLNIETIAVVNDDHEMIALESYDSSGESKNLTPETAEFLRQLTIGMGETDYHTGLSVRDDILMLITIRRIYSGDGLRSDSFLIMINEIDEAENRMLSTHISKEVSIVPGSIESYPGHEGYTQIAQDVYIEKHSQEYIDTLIQLYDIQGNPAIMASLSMDRDTSSMILSALVTFIVACLVSNFVVGFMFYFLTNKVVLEKISDMGQFMTRIVTESDTNTRIAETGDYEIKKLAVNFNQLLAKVNEKERLLLKNNRELKEANAQLMKMDEMKDLLLSNVSHEIRTPLTGINSYMQLLMSGDLDKSPKEKKEALKIVIMSINQLDNIVSDILDAAKFSQGKITMNKTEFLYHHAINEVLHEFKEILKNNAQVKVHDLKSLKITADQTRIKQVLRNLLSNAIKYRAKRKLMLDITVKAKNGFVFTTISDNGIGIAKEHINMLFHQFYQEDSTETKKVGGTGLGLSIVKSIIKAHEGKISVESEKGEGTAITFSIPMK